MTGRTPGAVRCRRFADLGVRDDLRCPAPRPQLRCVDRSGGWGLLMVTALADRWGVTGHEDGKTVWASVSTAAPLPGEGNDR